MKNLRISYCYGHSVETMFWPVLIYERGHGFFEKCSLTFAFLGWRFGLYVYEKK